MLYVTKTGSTYELDEDHKRVRMVFRPHGVARGSKRLASGKWVEYDDVVAVLKCRMLLRFGTDTVETSRIQEIVDLKLEGN